MPVNLNALIRYKTINSCLFGGKRRYDIDELIDACSDALSEARGRTTRISERTIRDDIRVMRSEILGFNAPIEQKNGLYYYCDPKYTILSVSITDQGILDIIIKSLLKISTDVKHPELEIILKKLRSFSPWSFESQQIEHRELYNLTESESLRPSSSKRGENRARVLDIEEETEDTRISFYRRNFRFVSWGQVFNLLQ